MACVNDLFCLPECLSAFAPGGTSRVFMGSYASWKALTLTKNPNYPIITAISTPVAPFMREYFFKPETAGFTEATTGLEGDGGSFNLVSFAGVILHKSAELMEFMRRIIYNPVLIIVVSNDTNENGYNTIFTYDKPFKPADGYGTSTGRARADLNGGNFVMNAVSGDFGYELRPASGDPMTLVTPLLVECPEP